LIKPTSGTATVNGYDILKEPSHVRSSIGIVFQAPSSDDMLTGYENLKLHSLLYGVPTEIRERRISEVLELVGLTDRKDNQVKKYSGGMRRRLEIAGGLIHKPKVIFLDEPTLGLDPASREVMWKYIERLVKEERISIILTTHYMEEADFLCNRVGIIDKGKIIALDSPSRLKESLGGEIIKIIPRKRKILTTSENYTISQKDYFDYIREVVKQYGFVNKIEFDNKDERTILIYVDDANRGLPKILRALDSLAIEIESVDFKSPTLNDVFLSFTGKHFTTDEDPPEGGFIERYATYDNKK